VLVRQRLGLRVVRIPEYSPFAVAAHAVALVLNKDAYARVREWNFSLDGLVGFDLHGKTVGIVGTGRIGERPRLGLSLVSTLLVAFSSLLV
jgi:D-lactate dehydrogenase